MRKITQWRGAVSLTRRALLAAVVLGLAGCSLSGFGAATTAPRVGPPIVITRGAVSSALVMVVNSGASVAAQRGLVYLTARPREHLTVLDVGTPPHTVVSATSPPPPTVTVPGKPIAPGQGTTTYLAAQYAGRLKSWHSELAAGRRAEAGRARDALSAWLRNLGLAAKVSRLADPPGSANSLVADSGAAASVLAGLAEENGNVFGSRRVLMLYTGDLSGRPPAGELTGDTVFVVTPYLPTAAAASAAQAALLAAGATQAAVVGPEVTGSELARLVSAGLSQGGVHESLLAPVLFANASAKLSPRAVAQLNDLLPQLRRAGVTAVINGFASAPGTALINYTLSYDRAAMVASFLESRGIPASSLIIVGHGASDLIASGSSGQNRRVTIVIEKS